MPEGDTIIPNTRVSQLTPHRLQIWILFCTCPSYNTAWNLIHITFPHFANTAPCRRADTHTIPYVSDRTCLGKHTPELWGNWVGPMPKRVSLEF